MARIWVFLVSLTLLTGVMATVYRGFSSPRTSDKVHVGPVTPIDAREADAIIERAKALKTGALLVVKDDAVILAWGDADKPLPIRSIRKSITNMVLGRLVLEGRLDLDATLDELGIDDEGFSLNEVEKQATVRQLMEARSGVYHLAAYELRSAAQYRPRRSEYEPGEFWYYNNWDFNVLETIAAQSAGHEDYCETFAKYAAPILNIPAPLSRCKIRHEEELSVHAAHLLRLTARELGRLAEVYLNNGFVDERRIFPEGWVAWSTEPVSDFHFISDSKFNYGRLFWSLDPYGPLSEPSYMARGAGSQYVWVMPEQNMAVIHLVRTWPLGLRKRFGLIPDDNDAWRFGGVIASAATDNKLTAPPLY